MSFRSSSQSVAYLLILLVVSVAEEKFLILRKSNISVSFMDCAVCVVSKNLSPTPRSSRFSLVLCSRSVLVLHFTFRSTIHFELIFVKCIKSVSGFIFFACGSSSSHTICCLKCLSSNFFFSFNVVLAILILLSFYVNFRISFSVATNSLLGFSLGLQWIYIRLGRIDILTVVCLPIHECGISLHLFSSLISFIKIS